MATRDIYDDGFDEQTTKQLSGACPECAGSLQTDGGETLCGACGLILEEHRLDRRGRRSFADDDRIERTGPPLTAARHDRGLSSEIGYKTDGTGNTLSGRKRAQLSRLRREHTRAKWRSKAERNLAHGCGEIARLVASLDLTRDVREQASALFRRAQGEDLLRGRSIEAIATGCVYAICRCQGITRTIEELSEVAQCSRSELDHAYRTLNTEIGLPTPPPRPAEFIASQASDLDLPAMVARRARELAEKATEDGLSNGVNPAGFAAACLAVAAAEHAIDVRQIALAEAGDVTPATVRTHRETLRSQIRGPAQ